jgi:Lipocalin-like domain
MGTRDAFKLLVLIIAAASIWLAGCKKTSPAAEAPTIVGTWGLDSEMQYGKSNNVFFRDTAFAANSANSFAITFSADGYYTEYTGSNIISSAYTVNGNTLSFYDTSGGQNTWLRYMMSLTTNKLQLSAADTIHGTSDTIFGVVFTFTR